MSGIDRTCTSCKMATAADAKFCPNCGNANISPKPAAGMPLAPAVSPSPKPGRTNGFGVLLVAGIIVVGLGAGSSMMYANWLNSMDPNARSGTDQRMAQIENSVAEDSIKQYETAKVGGNKADVCVHAGLVKAAFIQAKDDSNTLKWNLQEKLDCDKAGMPAL